ncbi:hypothetical protein HDU81_010271 [Chytriomyces hyalinus]|nr:hypothetical protein HDU81_010271 [Chytriomyces hyalinus]
MPQMNTKIYKQHYTSIAEEADRELPPLHFHGVRNNISDPSPSNTAPAKPFEIKRNFVIISSADRDRTRFPDSASFDVKLPDMYRDVVSMALYGGTIPNINHVGSDAYLLLDMGSDLSHLRSTSGQDWFAILGIMRHPNASYLNLDKSNIDDLPIQFRPPRDKLDKVSISLKHPDGSQVYFGSEPPTGPPNPLQQVTYIFEIRTRIPLRK